MTELKFQC